VKFVLLGALDVVNDEQVTAKHPAVLYLAAAIPEDFLACLYLDGLGGLSGADYKSGPFQQCARRYRTNPSMDC
jgi:hypothetical protein